MSISERLKTARNRVNLTQESANKLTGIGLSSLSDFENNKREPSLSQLSKLSRAYNCTLSYLLGEEDITDEKLLWRERPQENASEIEAKFLKLCEQYYNLERWTGKENEFFLPAVQGKLNKFKYPEAKKLADRVQREYNLGGRPAHSLEKVLVENGIKIFYLDFNPTGVAGCINSERLGPAILLNMNNVRWRRNFDLAHELFHLVTWNIFRNSNKLNKNLSQWEDEEKLATCFAGNLLMPFEPVKEIVEQYAEDDTLSLDAVHYISNAFDVSTEAFLWHIYYLFEGKYGDIEATQKNIERAKRSLTKLRKKGKPLPKKPERFVFLAKEALKKGEISIGKYAEYLGISREKANKELNNMLVV